MVIRIELPFPPSQNGIWRQGRGRQGRGRVYRSKGYMRWLAQANGEWLAQKPRGPFKAIEGKFKTLLLLSRPDKRSRDSDNYNKAPLDWAQRAGIVTNDKNSQETTVRWVTDEEAPMGAVLILTPTDC